jgi:hypothetical protein
MSLKQSKIQKSTALFDEDWLRSNARGAQTSSKGLQVKWRGSGGNSPSSPSAGRISTLGKHYAVVRVGKIKSMAKLSAAASHNSRDRETLNADPDRLDDNELIWGVEGSQDVLDAWQERAPDKVRSNAVHALEYVISASPAALAEMDHAEQTEYFRDSLRFLAVKHGAENILSAVVHRDEQTPHLQALVIPLDENERLNARAHVGGREKLRELQSDFADLVAEPYGIVRGRERSVARHRTIKDYYADAQKEPDASPERLKDAVPKRETGSVLRRGESDDAYTERLVDAVVGVAAQSAAAMESRINELEAEKRQTSADLDSMRHAANTMGSAARIAGAPDELRARAHWDSAQKKLNDPKFDPAHRDATKKIFDAIGEKHGFAPHENEREEPKTERPARSQRKRPSPKAPSRSDDYER